MKKYIKPQLYAEIFIANEYISVCWMVSCENKTTYWNHTSNATYGNLWSKREGPYDQSFSHDGSCRDASNNYFSGNSDGSNIQFIYESSSEQGNLTGGFDDWVDVNNNGTVDTGDVIYWYTSNGTRTWNHWGYVQSANSSHPNRS